MKICPKCGFSCEDEATVCPHCDTPFGDPFRLILGGERKLKLFIRIMCAIYAVALAVMILVLLVIGLPKTDGNRRASFLHIGFALLLLFILILDIALYIHNRADNVLNGKHQRIFCIVASCFGLFLAAIPFMVRGERIRRKLEEGDEEESPYKYVDRE